MMLSSSSGLFSVPISINLQQDQVQKYKSSIRPSRRGCRWRHQVRIRPVGTVCMYSSYCTYVLHGLYCRYCIVQKLYLMLLLLLLPQAKVSSPSPSTYRTVTVVIHRLLFRLNSHRRACYGLQRQRPGRRTCADTASARVCSNETEHGHDGPITCCTTPLSVARRGTPTWQSAVRGSPESAA
jgi:hypothetical protein